MSYIIDLHCHPALKPLGRSYSSSAAGINQKDKSKRGSIWHYDPPQGTDLFLQKLLGMTRFAQADFSSMAYGNVQIVCASMYRVENGLIDFRFFGIGEFTKFASNFISGLGRERIKHLQNNLDYFRELEKEYDYYRQLDGEEIVFKGEIKRKYIIVKNYTDLENRISEAESDKSVQTIFVIITFEGAHHFFNRSDHIDPANLSNHEAEVLGNVQKVKSWPHSPFFVTFGHHFYNGLCGHAESLKDFVQDVLTHQEFMMDTPFNSLGWKVVSALLDKTNGKRIYIDIKHMSYKSRIEYYRFLKANYPAEYAAKELPLIISHGACNGLASKENPVYHPGLEATAKNMYAADINFYDIELIELATSGGIIGLQLDERRIGSKSFIKSLKKGNGTNEKRHYGSKLLWNNIQHIVQLLDAHNLFAWDCIALGSDNDGIIDPINYFWTSEDFDDLIQYIERHAFNFLTNPETKFKVAANAISAAEAVHRVFYGNAFEFFRKYFK